MINRKIFSIILESLAWLYILIFLPLIFLISPLGLLAMAYPNMTAMGAIACAIGTTMIPCAMPVSAYFIFKKILQGEYLKALFFSFLPFLCAIGASIWFVFIVWIHELCC